MPSIDCILNIYYRVQSKFRDISHENNVIIQVDSWSLEHKLIVSTIVSSTHYLINIRGSSASGIQSSS